MGRDHLDGGVRKLDFIDTMEFPVFVGFKSSARSIGRWDIRAEAYAKYGSL